MLRTPGYGSDSHQEYSRPPPDLSKGVANALPNPRTLIILSAEQERALGYHVTKLGALRDLTAAHAPRRLPQRARRPRSTSACSLPASIHEVHGGRLPRSLMNLQIKTHRTGALG
jgi:hypothetical protein